MYVIQKNPNFGNFPHVANGFLPIRNVTDIWFSADVLDRIPPFRGFYI